MAFAIILDATVVRMLLVPALVTLMGPANWWMPRFGRWRQSARRRRQEGAEDALPAEREHLEMPTVVPDQ